MNKTLSIVIIIICIILSATFSGAEMSLARINKRNVKNKLTKELINNYGMTLSTILICNNIVNILSSSLATILFAGVFAKNNELYTTIIMTIIILTFGDIFPKIMASSFPETFTKIITYPVTLFKFIFYPISKFNNLIVSKVSHRFESKEETILNDDELITMVDEMEDQGVIDEDTQELITNAIDFVDVDAIEIMTHRVDVLAFDINDSIDTLINNPHLLDYSRIPVYDESIDNIVGILNTKQLLKMYLNKEDIKLDEILTEPLYVFKTQSISDILQEFKKKHIHVAIVKDEYGGTSGLLTLEDILEELVGDILDEKDIEELEEYHKVNKSRFTCDGEMNIYDFFDLINFNYEENEYLNDYTTLSGWLTGMMEKFPKEDDYIEFNGYRITVRKADDFTVERVSVNKIKKDSN